MIIVEKYNGHLIMKKLESVDWRTFYHVGRQDT